MKSLLILAASFLFVGCGLPQFPKFPESVKHTYVIDIDPRTKEVSCAKFDIVSTNPIKVKFNSFVDIFECQAIEGFQPVDTLVIKNYIDDVQLYATQVRCRLK